MKQGISFIMKVAALEPLIRLGVLKSHLPEIKGPKITVTMQQNNSDMI